MVPQHSDGIAVMVRRAHIAMRVTLIGHASIPVELEGGVCLMDPIFFDPFKEGGVVSCPRWQVYPEKLPRVDVLIISHRHPDHFDLRSPARVSRNVEVIVAADPLIVYAPQRLGFAQIHPVHSMAPISSDTFELYPTRSVLPSIQEFGMVFKDSSGTIWNQVDSLLTTDTIDRVVERFRRIDLLLAMYASRNFEYFESQSTHFPYETHRENLENVIRIGPRWVVPGSAGFRFCGDQAWLNSFLFSCGAEEASAEQIELCAAVHLALYELELGDLTLGLAVGPGLDDEGRTRLTFRYGARSSTVVVRPDGNLNDTPALASLDNTVLIDREKRTS